MEPSGFTEMAEAGGASAGASVTAALRAEMQMLRAQVSTELQAGLERVAARTDARLDEVRGTLEGRLTARLDATAADLRRTLNSALDVQVDAAAVTQATTADARSALESRAVILERAMGALAERIETLNREGGESARQQVRTLGADLATLRQWVDPVESRRLRNEAQDRLETALTSRDQRLLGTVSDLLTAVTSERVATQTRLLQLEDTTSRVLDALLTLEQQGASRAASTAQQVDILLAGTQDRVDAVRTDVRSQLAQIREELSSDLGTLRSELNQVSANSAAAGLAVETLPIRLEQALIRAQGAIMVDAAPAGQESRTALLQLLAEHRDEVTARMEKFSQLVAATAASTDQALQGVVEEIRRAASGQVTATAGPPAVEQPAETQKTATQKTATQKTATQKAATQKAATQKAAANPGAARKSAAKPRRSPAAAKPGEATSATASPVRSRAAGPTRKAGPATARRSPAAEPATATATAGTTAKPGAPGSPKVMPARETTSAAAAQPRPLAPRRAAPVAAARRAVRPVAVYPPESAQSDTAAQARAEAEQIEPVRRLFARRRT